MAAVTFGQFRRRCCSTSSCHCLRSSSRVIAKYPSLPALTFAIIAFLADRHLSAAIIKLPAIHSYAPFFLAPFLLGMSAAYLEPFAQRAMSRFTLSRNFADLISLTIIVMIIVSQYQFAEFTVTGFNAEFDRPYSMSACAAILLVWLAVGPPNSLSRVLSNGPLCALGTIGYSFYLWHWAVLQFWPTSELSPWPKTFLAAAITTLISAVSYVVIERPGIRCGHWLAGRIGQLSIPKRVADPDRTVAKNLTLG